MKSHGSSEKWRIFASAEKRPICLDMGSGFIKCGFAGEALPRCQIKTPPFVALVKRTPLFNRNSDGLIFDIEDALAKILRRIFFEELMVRPKEHRVVLCEAWDTPHTFREALARVMFTIFGVPSIYAESGCVLSLHAVGEKSGLVIDIGKEETRVLPVVHGVPLHFAASAVPLGALSVETHMKRIIQASWTRAGLTEAHLSEHLPNIVATLCHVQTIDDAHDSIGDAVYRCASKTVVISASARIMPCEILFQQMMVSDEEESDTVFEHSIMDAISSSLTKLNFDCRHQVVDNIILSGGMACIPGIFDRVRKELASLATKKNAKSTALKQERTGYGIRSVQCLCGAKLVQLPFSPRFISWIGASIIGSVENLRGLSLSSDAWRRAGMRLIDRSALA